MRQDSRSIGALVRQRGLDSVSGPGFALPRSPAMSALAIGRQVLSPAAPGASRNTMRTHCDGVSAPGVLAEPFASFELGAEGPPAAAPRGSRTGLLHLGGLHGVSDCWRWWLRQQQEPGVGGCEKSNCPAAGRNPTGLGAKTITESRNHPRKGQKVRGGARETQRGVLHQFDRD